jgi:hypothetical protein
MPSHEQQLRELERLVSELEKKLATTLPANEDWDDDGDVDNNSDDDNGDVDSADDDDDDDSGDDLDTLAHKIAARRGLPLDEALTQARQRRPDLYTKLRRDPVNKSFTQLVEQEIAKGRSPDCAAQVVAYAHPHLAPHDISKADDAVAEFMGRCDAVMQADGVSRTEAMQIVRKRNPRLFGYLRNV